MKYFFGFLLQVCSLPAVFAQQDITLPGIVVEQNSKYRTGNYIYLSNVQIKATGATPQHSDANGRFTLVFTDRPGGDVARIFAAKKGYELVNDAELKQASVIGRLQPLQIVMCLAGQLYENQVKYYNIAKDASLAAYKRNLAALEKGGREKEKLLANLRVQFNQEIKTKDEALDLLDRQRQMAEEQAKMLSDKWVTLNLDDESPAYQRAFAAFEARDIELAKAILDSVDLEQRLKFNSWEKRREENLIDTLQQNIIKRETEIRQDAGMCVFKARLHVIDNEFAEAERFYDLAVKYVNENLEIIFEAALYMQNQKQFIKAETYYGLALAQCQNEDQKATVLSNLGILLSYNSEIAAARKANEEALTIRRQLAFKNPDEYLPDLASTLNNLGVLLMSINEIVEARKVLEEAQGIRRQLVVKNPDIYLPDLAMTLDNLGTLLMSINEMAEARKAYEEALMIRRQLTIKNPDTYLPDLATTLSSLGNLSRTNYEIAESKKAYEEALTIRRQLAVKNPDVHLPYVAATLNRLGVLLWTNNEIVAARKVYEEALEIRRQLAVKNPTVYLRGVASDLNNLGNLLSHNNEIVEALKTYKEALKIYRQLAVKNPEINLPDVASTLNNLGNLLININEIAEARKVYLDALAIYRQLAIKTPDAYLPDVATALTNLGILLSDNNEIALAQKAYKEALGIRRQLALKNPNTYLPDVAGTLSNFGNLLISINEIEEARKTYEEGLEIYRQLAVKNPDIHLPSVATTLNNLGVLLCKNKEIAYARKAYEEALTIRRQLAVKNPDVYLPDVATTLSNLGVLLSDINEIEEARKTYEEALEIRRLLVIKYPDAFLPYLATTLNNLGVLFCNNNKIAAARKAYEEALGIRRQLAVKNPDVYLPDLATTLNNLGNLLSINSEVEAALKTYEEALGIRRQLAVKNPEINNAELAATGIGMALANWEWLNKSGIISLKEKGLTLLNEVSQHLGFYKSPTPWINVLKEKAKQVTKQFESFDITMFQISEKLTKSGLSDSLIRDETSKQVKVSLQQKKVAVIIEFLNKYPDNSKIKNLLASSYGSLAWYQLFNKQFAAAEQSALLGLQEDRNEEWINTNLALAFLYQGKWAEAQKIYQALKDKPYMEGSYKTVFLEDLEALEKEGITHPDMEKVRNLLLGK